MTRPHRWAAGPYDRAVDPITARRVLRIFPDAPLTADLVERAHAAESAARHPSRYPEGEDRARAEEWARTLGTARAVLLAEANASGQHPPVAAPVASVPAVAPVSPVGPLGATPGWQAPAPLPAPDLAAAVNAPRRRGLSRGAVIGIVAGAVALVLLVVAGVVGISGLVDTVSEATRALETESAPSPDDTSLDGDDLPDVERYSAEETFFTFPAAVELYFDGRYNADCPMDYVEGCWQAAIITEADCEALEVQLGFANDPDAADAEHLATMDFTNVVAGEAVPVVFGQDEYDSGWLNDVRCLD